MSGSAICLISASRSPRFCATFFASALYSSVSMCLNDRSSSSQRSLAIPKRWASGAYRSRVSCAMRTPLLRRQILERPHVVQAVGELDDDDARVLGDREEQLAIALDLPLLRRSARRQLGDLREAVDDVGDRAPELLLHVGDRELRVLDDVVQQTGGDRHRIELQLGENLRDLDRVRDVRLARVAALAAVRLFAVAIGVHEQIAVELVVDRRLVFAPTRHHLADGRARGGHRRPASAKLV